MQISSDLLRLSRTAGQGGEGLGGGQLASERESSQKAALASSAPWLAADIPAAITDCMYVGDLCR